MLSYEIKPALRYTHTAMWDLQNEKQLYYSTFIKFS